MNGHVRLRRRSWHEAGVGPAHPSDALAGLAQRTVSVGAQELMCRLNQSAGSFHAAAANLLAAAQLRASKEQVRRVVEHRGRAVLAAQQRFTLAPAWTAEDCKVGDTRQTRVYLGVDGVIAPMVTMAEKHKRRENVLKKRRARGQAAHKRTLGKVRGGADQPYKELKLVLFYDEHNTHQHVVVTRHDHRVAGKLIDREARRLQVSTADETITNTDGAVWIDHRIQESRVKFDGRGLDFYHLSEHVHQTRRALFGEDPAGVAWAGDVLHTVKHEGYTPAWSKLTEHRAKLRGKTKRRSVDHLLHYLAQRQHLINYPQFLARGWQIGSGPTEAACKTVTQRLKGRGRRWNPANAEALAALAAIDQSGQWDNYWPTLVTA